MAEAADDELETVKEKERRLERLGSHDRWKSIADLWCACWMWPDSAAAPNGALFDALRDEIEGRHASLPSGLASSLLVTARGVADAHRFFHWMLEFPELYFDDEGAPLANPGFDAVIGNPPWDMLRADSGDSRQRARDRNRRMTRFVRESGIYRLQGAGHLNRYQLFTERALTLLKQGGRLGLVLPSGLATDDTSSALRRALIERHGLESLVGFDNRRAVFPIHRSVRFLLCTATAGAATKAVRCRFGVQDPALLDTLGDPPTTGFAYPIVMTPAFIFRTGGDRAVIPDLREPIDARIVEGIAHRFPRLGDADGWNVRFGRELNATEDRRYFRRTGSGLPVLEGKHIEPFVAHTSRPEWRILERDAIRLMGSAGGFRRERLGYRDVASATNRTSLIAAILPRGVVTTHSLFVLKSRLTPGEQRVLCALLNSYVANYLVRAVMTTHLGSTLVEELRTPTLQPGSALFLGLAEMSARLQSAGAGRPGPAADHASRAQALAAAAYQLDADEFRHVLGTFPLVPESERRQALTAFLDLAPR